MAHSLSAIRHDWKTWEVQALFAQPLLDLVYHAQKTHRDYFQGPAVQLSALLNIKGGGCPEDCAYCPQSIHHATGETGHGLLSTGAVLAQATEAKKAGATRFCMGAAWRTPKESQIKKLTTLIAAVKTLGLETCLTAGFLNAPQAEILKKAGLDYYNHNIDTSPEFYAQIISTRTFQDRLNTLAVVRTAGIKVCSGGIIGMGESPADRAEMLRVLATLPEHPESVPINRLVRVAGTPLADCAPTHPFDWVQTIAVARILMPRAYIRLSAGRTELSDEAQALCFMAGANSVFYGEQLLTTDNPDCAADQALFKRLGIQPDLLPA